VKLKLIDFKRLAPDKGITYSRDHLRRKVKANEFPAPISVSDHRIGWDEDEIDEWHERQRILDHWTNLGGAEHTARLAAVLQCTAMGEAAG
jgi:predicted DNA-binding transcriptional regulator AlpA